MKREGASYPYERSRQVKTNYYVDGNTVRRLEGEPEERRRRQEERERAKRRRQTRHAARRNRERVMGISPGYVIFCTAVFLLFCTVCVSYIQLQSDITGRMRRISRLESQVADLKADNDAAMKRIDLSTDLDTVKQQALGLGMHYAGSDQIVYYSVDDEDFMNQYSDIPQK